MYQEKINYFAGKIIPKCSVDGFEDTLRDLITFDGIGRRLTRVSARSEPPSKRTDLRHQVVVAGEVGVTIATIFGRDFFYHGTYEFEAESLDFNVIIRISAERSRIFNEIYRKALEVMATAATARGQVDPSDLETFDNGLVALHNELLSILPH